jgi:PHD and RING finger domain-containing protein 1
MEEKNFSNGNLPSTSKDAEDTYESDSSTDSSGVDKCPICLLAFTADKEVGKPSVCEHQFCFPCIHEWSKVVRTCPIDRKEFNEIRVYDNLEGDNLLRTVELNEKVALNELISGDDEFTPCEICQNTDREDCMLLCDGCDKGESSVIVEFRNLC